MGVIEMSWMLRIAYCVHLHCLQEGASVVIICPYAVRNTRKWVS